MNSREEILYIGLGVMCDTGCRNRRVCGRQARGSGKLSEDLSLKRSGWNHMETRGRGSRRGMWSRGVWERENLKGGDATRAEGKRGTEVLMTESVVRKNLTGQSWISNLKFLAVGFYYMVSYPLCIMSSLVCGLLMISLYFLIHHANIAAKIW